MKKTKKTSKLKVKGDKFGELSELPFSLYYLKASRPDRMLVMSIRSANFYPILFSLSLPGTILGIMNFQMVDGIQFFAQSMCITLSSVLLLRALKNHSNLFRQERQEVILMDFTSLPHHSLRLVFSFLSGNELASVAGVSKMWFISAMHRDNWYGKEGLKLLKDQTNVFSVDSIDFKALSSEKCVTIKCGQCFRSAKYTNNQFHDKDKLLKRKCHGCFASLEPALYAHLTQRGFLKPISDPCLEHLAPKLRRSTSDSRIEEIEKFVSEGIFAEREYVLQVIKPARGLFRNNIQRLREHFIAKICYPILATFRSGLLCLASWFLLIRLLVNSPTARSISQFLLVHIGVPAFVFSCCIIIKHHVPSMLERFECMRWRTHLRISIGNGAVATFLVFSVWFFAFYATVSSTLIAVTCSVVVHIVLAWLPLVVAYATVLSPILMMRHKSLTSGTLKQHFFLPLVPSALTLGFWVWAMQWAFLPHLSYLIGFVPFFFLFLIIQALNHYHPNSRKKLPLATVLLAVSVSLAHIKSPVSIVLVCFDCFDILPFFFYVVFIFCYLDYHLSWFYKWGIIGGTIFIFLKVTRSMLEDWGIPPPEGEGIWFLLFPVALYLTRSLSIFVLGTFLFDNMSQYMGIRLSFRLGRGLCCVAQFLWTEAIFEYMQWETPWIPIGAVWYLVWAGVDLARTCGYFVAAAPLVVPSSFPDSDKTGFVWVGKLILVLIC